MKLGILPIIRMLPRQRRIQPFTTCAMEALKDVTQGPLFNSRWYLENNPDVKDAKENQLVHYRRYGNKDGRRKSLSMV